LNIKGNPDVVSDCNTGIRANWNSYFCTLGGQKKARYMTLLDEMLDYYGIKALTSKGGIPIKGYKGLNKVPRAICTLIESYKHPMPEEKYREMYELTGVKSGYISLPAKPPEHVPVQMAERWKTPRAPKSKPNWIINLENKFPVEVE